MSLPSWICENPDKEEMAGHFVTCDMVSTGRLLLSLSFRGGVQRVGQDTEEAQSSTGPSLG